MTCLGVFLAGLVSQLLSVVGLVLVSVLLILSLSSCSVVGLVLVFVLLVLSLSSCPVVGLVLVFVLLVLSLSSCPVVGLVLLVIVLSSGPVMVVAIVFMLVLPGSLFREFCLSGYLVSSVPVGVMSVLSALVLLVQSLCPVFLLVLSLCLVFFLLYYSLCLSG